MEITSASVYWITRLDSLKDVVSILSIISAIGVFFGVLFGPMILDCCNGETMNPKVFWKWVKVLGCIGLGSALVYAISPTSKEAAAIYLIPKIANNEKVQAIPSKLLTLADEWMEELRPKK